MFCTDYWILVHSNLRGTDQRFVFAKSYRSSKENHRVAEMVEVSNGLGYMILKSQRYLAADTIFAGLILIGLIGLITDWIFRILTRIVAPWQEKRWRLINLLHPTIFS